MKEIIEAFAAPFPARDHEFLQGYAYLTEGAIASRLDEVYPAWSWELLDPPASRQTSAGITIVQRGRLTVNGVSRDGVGMAAVAMTKSGNGEANEAEKSAATDAFKRAARLFGIGRYLLDLPNDVRDIPSLDRWLKGGAKNAPSAPQNGNGQHPQPAPQPAQKKNDPPPMSASVDEFYADTAYIKKFGDQVYYVFAGQGKTASTFDHALAGKAGQVVTLAPAGAQIAISANVMSALETKKDGSKFWKATSIVLADPQPEPAGAAVPF